MQWSSSSSKCSECWGRSFYLYAGLSPPSSSLALLQRTLAAYRTANQAQKSAPKTLEKSGQKCSKFVEVKICQNDETYQIMQNEASSTLLMSIPLWGRRAKDGQGTVPETSVHTFPHSVPVWRMGCDWCNGINGGYSSHLGLPATNGVGKKPIQSCLLVLFISSFLFTCWAVSTRPNITVFVKKQYLLFLPVSAGRTKTIAIILGVKHVRNFIYSFSAYCCWRRASTLCLPQGTAEFQ